MNEREFQRKARERLQEGCSVLIIAPTGLGKTRAALLPFIKGRGLLGTRLLYALPLRALTRSVIKEFRKLSGNMRMFIHHGEESESEIFSENAVVTTIDQYFTAFAGAPLSWASHKSHAAAGAILTSYSVFDEVHLLSPRYGLPLLFAILKLRQRWGLPSCVMTATMPHQVVDFFCQHCRLTKVEATPNDVAERDSWRKVTIKLLGDRTEVATKKGKRKVFETKWVWEEYDIEKLASFVKEKWESWNSLSLNGLKKIIIFINTVERAIQVYERLENLLGTNKILLAHSRFTKEDRRNIERELLQKFGQDSDFEGILVTTQVAEAGLNISASLVITELCPMDSFIQRAGRCIRFKPKNEKEARGEIIVIKPPEDKSGRWYLPYEKNPSERTKEILEAFDGITLSWDIEQGLVDEALGPIFEAYLRGASEPLPTEEEEYGEN